MKKIILTYFVVVAFGSGFTCTYADYRDIYTGTYRCKSYRSHLDPNTMAYKTNADSINIVVSKDVIDSILQIKIGSQVLQAKLINKGLRAYPSAGKYGGRFFSSDSLKLKVISSMASSTYYEGKKNSGM